MEGIAKNVEVTLSQNVDNEMALRLSNALNSMLKNIALQDFGTDMVDSIADLTRAEMAVLREMLPILQETLLEERPKSRRRGLKICSTTRNLTTWTKSRIWWMWSRLSPFWRR